MKKVLLIILISVINPFTLCGQDVIVDSGYYYGQVLDSSLVKKFLFMSFLSNDGDNILYIVPYIKLNDTSFMHDNFKKSINLVDSIDGNVFEEKIKWTVQGFDNSCYYTIEENNIHFSLNIVNLNSEYLNIFKFNGQILDNGNIQSVITSTDSTFYNSNVLLTYKKFQDD